ncbi:MAG: HD domain-containing protein [Candidatus Thermoplasmatota archaeon]|nr:HD domain-containing protein [Candidatus Thermoplasmatota archaeon]MBU4071465.1 HD domain-containing protein [Candidatus Thermoplasmatota archaeon]MBU4144272.1 HD domain-containing protein [Candidatus Thermoplasmatota archaeon]MBU4592344.1 HD domain-containing protein [Candidatus Thermoplasmatota archaeon]
MIKNQVFLPEKPLRYLGYNKILGKSTPPQTLYWHCLNTYYCAETISRLIPVKLNETEKRVLCWASLLHDAGKGTESWGNRGHGPHTPDENVRNKIIEIFNNEYLTSSYAPISDEEKNLIIELITEHHTRKTLSNVDVERIMKIIKLADKITSKTRIDSSLVNEVAAFLQPNYKPIVLSAEDHPASYYALSIADIEAEKDNRAVLLLTNKLQSLYLIQESINIEAFKDRINKTVTTELSLSHEGSETLKRVYSWVSELPIRDQDSFFIRIHTDKSRILEEIDKSLKNREKQLSNNKKKGLPVDERELWFGPFRILLDVTKRVQPTNNNLLGTTVPLTSIDHPGSPVPDKEIAITVAKNIGATDPNDYIAKVIELIINNTSPPQQSISLNLDIFHWSDDILDATATSKIAYEHYRKTQWNSKYKKRSVNNYCFSCKRRNPTRDAPTGNLPTDTWTSSVADKNKIQVCDLCFTAQAYILPRLVKGKFHVDATPAYNQARIDWENIFWQGLVTQEFIPSWVSSHYVILDLHADTPNKALVNTLGYTLEFEHETTKEYRSYADLLFMHGLHGTISAGPQHPGKSMLTGCGMRIDFSDWEKYGGIMKMLSKTHPQKVFPANQVWQKLTRNDWGWGTLLAIRHRRDKIKAYHITDIQELINMKSTENEGTLLERIRTIPLLVENRDERFKAAEGIFRRMDRATRTAAKHSSEYGTDDSEIIQRISELGKKQLRARIMKNSITGTWTVSDERLAEVEKALTEIAKELWKLRNNHMARNDFINAAIMAIAYNPRKED